MMVVSEAVSEKQKYKKRKPPVKDVMETNPIIKEMKLFGKWDSNVDSKDPGLSSYINLKPRFMPRSAGTYRERFHKSKMHIVERLALNLLITGHSGKRHRVTSGRFGGGLYTALRSVENAFDMIEKKENKNPVQVFVIALENAAVREEITTFQSGSVVVREAVITAPQRRIDKTLRFMARGAYKKSFHTKKTLSQALAEEIINAYSNNNQSVAIQEKERIEREAQGAR